MRSTSIIAIACFVLVMVLLSPAAEPRTHSTLGETRTGGLAGKTHQLQSEGALRVGKAERVANYLLAIPAEYDVDAQDRWPVILHLHGGSWRGNDLTPLVETGPLTLLPDKVRGDFIHIVPQCPTDAWWSEAWLVPLLDEVQRSLNIDKSRIFVMGMSMGGSGTWRLAMKAPGRFAAIIPICGQPDVRQARRLVNLPIWSFHGQDDQHIKPDASIAMQAKLEELGATQAKLTLYPGVGHDAWTPTYANTEVFAWLKRQSLPEKAAGNER